MNLEFINYGQHFLDDEDMAAVIEVMRNGALTGGDRIIQFEQALQEYTNAQHAVICSSGTAALHLASQVVIQPNDIAIVPAMTFLATANAVKYCQGEVIFADVDPESGLMGPKQLLEAIQRADGATIRAVFPVHLTGQCENLEEISKIAKSNSMAVIEDACHAIGSEYTSSLGSTVKVGNSQFSDMVVFSFHPVKHIATGEGGAVLCNNEAYAHQLRALRSHGMTRDPALFVDEAAALDSTSRANPWYYEMQQLGYNYRMSDLQAALGCSQLQKLNQFIKHRGQLKNDYDQLLADYGDFVRPIKQMSYCRAAWHIYCVLIDFEKLGKERSMIMRELRKRGIGTQVHYIPVHQQPFYRRLYGDISLPGAENYYAKTLTLPLFYNMTKENVKYIVEQLVDVLGVGK